MMRLCFSACFLGALVLSANSHADFIAADSQADAAYASWDPGDNGGFGWGGGWTFRNQGNTVLTTTNGDRGWFVSDSRGNDNVAGDTNGDFDINTPKSAAGKAWGLYSNATDQVYAIRPFANPLQVGQTVVWEIDNGNINSGQVVGLRLLSNALDVNSREFEARFVGGDSFYTLVANPSQTSTIGFTREGLHLEYTLTTATTFSLKIVRLENNVTQTMTGVNVAGNAIVALAFKNQFAGTGNTNDAYLNNISLLVVPEASAALLCGCVAAACGIGALAARVRRIRRCATPSL